MDADGQPVSGGRLLGDEALTTGHPQAPLTVRLTRPDGTPAWVWISSAPVLDADGRPEGVVSTMSDVTQSREAEQRLVASERRRAPWRTSRRRCAASPRSWPARPRRAPCSSRSPRRSRACWARPSASVLRYEADGHATVVGSWRDAGLTGLPLGASLDLDGDSVVARVYRSGHPERIDNYDDAPGALAERLRALGYRSSVAAPLSVGGRLWGVLVASTTRSREPGAGSERRLCDFAELVAQALSNADAYDKLAGSRARIVEAGDAERRRLERNLHDGAQQRLVSLALQLRMVEGSFEANPDRARQDLAEAREQLGHALQELRELARGIHPAVLTDRGLGPALSALAHRAPVPVEIERRARRAPARARRGRRLLPHRRGDHQRRQARPGDPRRGQRAPRRRGASSSRSPTTASAAPTPGRARASAASPTASRRSTGTCASTAHPAAARAWRRASRSR